MTDQIYYSRAPLPESNAFLATGGSNLLATRFAISDVLAALERHSVDPAGGKLTVTYGENSELTRTFVEVEWRPNA